ncbi:MAG: hypothetical protein R2909_07320, partial [Gemmatimonadales bacterium]
MSSSLRPRLFAIALLGGMSACSSGGDGGTQPGPSPAISISLNPNSASVAQGGSATVVATLTRSGGFSGTVALTVQGAPTGVTGTVGSEQTANGITTATITIQVAASTTPGSYTLTARGSGSGVSDATATFTLTVTAVTPAGFTIAAQPTTLSIQQGANATSTISVARTGGFGGAVALSAQAPAGLTASFNPTSVTGASSTLTVAAGASLAAGNYTVTVTGAATGLTNQTTQVAVTVTASPGGGSGNATIDYSSCGLIPTWFAYQDGSGPWTVLAPTNFKYSFSVSGPTAGIAWVTGPTAANSQVYVQYFSKAEITAGPLDYCASANLGSKGISGTVAGLGAGDRAQISLGAGIGGTVNGNGPFGITGVHDGNQDLIGWRRHPTGANPDRGFVRRDQDIPHLGTVGTVDFAGSESFTPASATITVMGFTGVETVNHGVTYWTTASCYSAPLYQTSSGPSTGFTAMGFPTGVQRSTDYHQLNVTAVTGAGTPVVGYTESRTVSEFFHDFGDRTITRPPSLGMPTIADLSGAYKRLRATFTVDDQYASVLFQTTTLSPTRLVASTATKAALGGTTAILTIPDWSGLPGWNDQWMAGPAAT